MRLPGSQIALMLIVSFATFVPADGLEARGDRFRKLYDRALELIEAGGYTRSIPLLRKMAELQP